MASGTKQFQDLVSAISIELSRCIEQKHLMRESWAVVRTSDFNLWIDRWGVAAGMATSLDARLQALPIADQRSLEESLRGLKLALSDVQKIQAEEECEKSIEAVNFFVSQLHREGMAIRWREKRPRILEADRTFDPQRQLSLREYFQCIVLLRPTASALFRPVFPPTVPKDWLSTMPNLEVINLEMTPLQERLIEANLRRRYRFLWAQREENEAGISVPESTAAPTDDIAAKSHKAGQYPSPPGADGDFKCPCCCQYLSGTMATDTKAWRQHLLQDIQPFTCIAEGCPTPGVLYSTRTDWERHVETDHRPNRWVCPVCRDMGTATEDAKALLPHMWNRHADALPAECAIGVCHVGAITSYGITSCPLCEKTGHLDSPELIDHVLRHTHDFALQALPWPKQTQDHAPAPGSRPGTYSMRRLTDPDYVLWWLNGRQ